MEISSTEIAKRLPKIAEYEQGIELVRICDRRRTEIRERLGTITARPAFLGQTTLRLQAIQEGLDAVKKLDDEAAILEAEVHHLSQLEGLCQEAAERCRVQGIRDAAPKAVKNVPRGIARVREALRALDSEIALLNRDTNTLAELIGLPGETFPFDDEEAAALFQLRDEVWTTRRIIALVPPSLELPAPGMYPKTVSMAIRWKDWETWVIEYGPSWPRPESFAETLAKRNASES